MAIRKKLTDGLNWVESRFTDNSAILLYHRVATRENDGFNLCVTPEHFAQQMEVLASMGTVLPLDEFIERQRTRRLAPGSLCVTFDDGYLDVFENALPILEACQIPATVFVVSGGLGEAFWWDRMVDLIHRPASLPEVIEIKDRAGSLIGVRTSGLSRERVMRGVYPTLRSLDPEARRRELDSLAAAVGRSDHHDGPVAVAPDALREFARHPLLSIGAHTESHSQLASLSALGEKSEIVNSIRDLADVIGQPIRTFSYPFGLKGRDYTDRTLETARAAGLAGALAADLNVVTAQSDPFALPRLWIHDRNGDSFQKYLKRWLGKGSFQSLCLPS